MPHGCSWSLIISQVVAKTVLRESVLSPVVRPMESRRIGEVSAARSSIGWTSTWVTAVTAPPPSSATAAPTATAWWALPSRSSRKRRPRTSAQHSARRPPFEPVSSSAAMSTPQTARRRHGVSGKRVARAMKKTQMNQFAA